MFGYWRMLQRFVFEVAKTKEHEGQEVRKL